MIGRRGRTIFTPSNVTEVRLRFERILARVDDRIEAPFQADPDVSEADELDPDTPSQDGVEPKPTRRTSDRAEPVRTPVAEGSRSPRGSRRSRLTLAELYLKLRARALEEDERRRLPDRRPARTGRTDADTDKRTR